MSNLIFLIIGFGAGCYYMWWKFKKDKLKKSEKDSAAKLEQEKSKQEISGIAKVNETRQNAKAKAKDRILKLFDNRTEITNDDVQKLLAVSDATVTNYLDELEQEGIITQIGKEGRGVKYVKNG